MSDTPHFSENEQTPAQRWDTVQFALGVSASAGGQASAESVQLYERYILGEIDLEHVGAAVRQLYPQYPSNDPHAGRWTPNLDAEPVRPLEASPDYELDSTDDDPEAEPEQPAEVYIARLRAYVQEIANYVTTLPPRQRYIYFDDTQQVSL